MSDPTLNDRGSNEYNFNHLEIERLRKERGVWKANAETNLGEVERLRQAYDQLQNRTSDQYDEQQAEIERLQRALENIRDQSSPEGWTVRDYQEYAAEVLEVGDE